MKNIPAITLLLLVYVGGLCASEKPNIILLMGDDHGWEETSYNGHPFLKTPILDEMVSSGLRLNNFYAAHPTCSPTRGSVLTGRHPNRYGTFVPNYSIRPKEITIAQIVKKVGYATGHFGKWHLGPVKKNSPTNPGAMGFDVWLSHDNFFELNPSLSHNGGSPKIYRGESSQILINHTIQFIQKSKQAEKPFFAVVWFGSPHEPYSGLKEDLAMYNDLPEKYAQKQVKLTSNVTGKPTSRPLRDVLRERYAEITAMDRAIGELRDYLKRAALKENTMLWYCGDNGTPPSGAAVSPLRGMKATMYEGGIRVPGIIEWPARISQPGSSNLSCVTSDMLPTICAMIEQALPERPLDGVNLLPLLDGKMETRPKPIFFWSFDMENYNTVQRKPFLDQEMQRGTTPLVKYLKGIKTRNFENYHHPTIEAADFAGDRVIIDGRYKLHLRNAAGQQPSVEMYDLVKDPSESKDLSMTNKDLSNQLTRQIQTWQKSVLNSLSGADY